MRESCHKDGDFREEIDRTSLYLSGQEPYYKGMSDTVQVTLIKEGRAEYQYSELKSPEFTDERAKTLWLNANNAELRADRIAVSRNGKLRTMGYRIAGGGYQWKSV